jgi:hypothetical protein
MGSWAGVRKKVLAEGAEFFGLALGWIGRKVRAEAWKVGLWLSEVRRWGVGLACVRSRYPNHQWRTGWGEVHRR